MRHLVAKEIGLRLAATAAVRAALPAATSLAAARPERDAGCSRLGSIAVNLSQFLDQTRQLQASKTRSLRPGIAQLTVQQDSRVPLRTRALKLKTSSLLQRPATSRIRSVNFNQVLAPRHPRPRFAEPSEQAQNLVKRPRFPFGNLTAPSTEKRSVDSQDFYPSLLFSTSLYSILPRHLWVRPLSHTHENSAFINVLSMSSLDATTRAKVPSRRWVRPLSRTHKNSAFINVLSMSSLDTTTRAKVPPRPWVRPLSRTHKNSAFINVLTVSSINTPININCAVRLIGILPDDDYRPTEAERSQGPTGFFIERQEGLRRRACSLPPRNAE
jgi:hypothetical protein